MANIVTDLIEQAEDIKRRKWCSDKDCAKGKKSWCKLCHTLRAAAEQLTVADQKYTYVYNEFNKKMDEERKIADALREDIADLAHDLQLGHVCETCSRKGKCLKGSTGWMTNKQCVDWEYKNFVTDVVGKLRWMS